MIMKSRFCERKNRALKDIGLKIDSTEFASQNQFFLRFEFDLTSGLPQNTFQEEFLDSFLPWTFSLNAVHLSSCFYGWDLRVGHYLAQKVQLSCTTQQCSLILLHSPKHLSSGEEGKETVLSRKTEVLRPHIRCLNSILKYSGDVSSSKIIHLLFPDIQIKRLLFSKS